MREATRFVVVARSVDDAAPLRGVAPSDADVALALMGRPRDEAVDAAAFGFTDVAVVPAMPLDSAPELVGPTIQELLGDAVCLLDSSQSSRDLAGWLVAMSDAAIVSGIERIVPEGDAVAFHRNILGGTHRLVHAVDGEGPVVVLARPAAALEPAPAASVAASPRVVESTPGTSRVRVIERAKAVQDGVSLRDARVVVSVGRGIRAKENVEPFRDLAKRVGGALGASRVAVDSGWVPFAHQVGQTGSVVSPDVYLAFGISGAIQHQAGMRRSRRIVAVNTDPAAPICRIADLLIEADALDVARRLIDRLDRRVNTVENV